MDDIIYTGADCIVYINVRGDQDYATVRHAATIARREVRKLIRRHQPVKLLVKLDNIGNVTPGAIKATIQFLLKEPYDQVALCSPKGLLGFILMLIIDAVKDRDKLLICHNEAQARAWLCADKVTSSGRSSTRSVSVSRRR